jgi:hypothetical protein
MFYERHRQAKLVFPYIYIYIDIYPWIHHRILRSTNQRQVLELYEASLVFSFHDIAFFIFVVNVG